VMGSFAFVCCIIWAMFDYICIMTDVRIVPTWEPGDEQQISQLSERFCGYREESGHCWQSHFISGWPSLYGLYVKNE